MKYVFLFFVIVVTKLGMGGEIFRIGEADGRGDDLKIFRNLGDDRHIYEKGFDEKHRAFRDVDECVEFFKKPIVFEVGKSGNKDFPFVHPFKNCNWAGIGGEAPTYKILFDSPKNERQININLNESGEKSEHQKKLYSDKKYYLKLGFADSAHNHWIGLKIWLNGKLLRTLNQQFGLKDNWLGCGSSLAYFPNSQGVPSVKNVIEIPSDILKKDGSKNELELQPFFDKNSGQTLWLCYDFIKLDDDANYPEIADLRTKFVDRAIEAMGTEEVVFCASGNGRDWHWYANFGKTICAKTGDENIDKFFDKEVFSRLGCKLVVYNLRTGAYRYLIDDAKGSLRDPQVSFDGKKILFSYRQGESDLFHLYEIDADGKNLRKLPIAGDWNDIEPCYLPNGDILYCSDRLNKYVQCWFVPVSNLHRWFREENVTRCITVNPDVDNRPRLLADGRIIYTRWEYNHRTQLGFHNLWTIQPDGSNEMIYLGNEKPGGLYIGAEQMPDKEGVVFTLADGHGRKDHQGKIARAVAPFDPSNPHAFEIVNGDYGNRHYDPFPLKGGLILASDGGNINILDDAGQTFNKFKLPADLLKTEAKIYYNVPEDRYKAPLCKMIIRNVQPLTSRVAPPMRADAADFSKKTATVFIQDIYRGRKMAGVKRGSIKKLMIVQMLPEPAHFHGGFHPIGISAGFALEKILGTVPVEDDGSAAFEVPSQKALAFIALDENLKAVKRMQSFIGFAPATSTSCIGCHENRTEAPERNIAKPMAYGKISKIEKIKEVPAIIDFLRHVQPILDKYCVECHSPENPTAAVILTGDRGALNINSRFILRVRGKLNTGFNKWGNQDPYTFGSGGSKIMEKAEGKHHNKKFDETSMKILRAWLDTGSMQVGTFASANTGFAHNYYYDRLHRREKARPENIAAVDNTIRSRCAKCHIHGDGHLPLLSWGDDWGHMPVPKNGGGVKPSAFSRQFYYNYTRPEKSLVLLKPLAKSAGGLADDKDKKCHPIVFSDKNDADYQKILQNFKELADWLKQDSPFQNEPNFHPNIGYIKTMQKCKILPPDHPLKKPLDAMQIDEEYFKWQEENISHSFGKP